MTDTPKIPIYCLKANQAIASLQTDVTTLKEAIGEFRKETIDHQDTLRASIDTLVNKVVTLETEHRARLRVTTILVSFLSAAFSVIGVKLIPWL